MIFLIKFFHKYYTITCDSIDKGEKIGRKISFGSPIVLEKGPYIIIKIF